MNTPSRKQRKLPDHLDEVDLGALFTRLEERPETPQSKRVERLLDLLSRLRGRLSTRDAKEAFTGLLYALSRYRWVRRVAFTREGFRVLSFVADRGYLSEDDSWEYAAVRDLLDIVPYLGDPPRIRRCADQACQKWFFAANRSDQKFCCGNCRQHYYDSDEKTHARKLERMRQNYATEKERDRKLKSLVGVAERRTALPRGEAKRRKGTAASPA